ncbi:hypothetical protein F5144DRAFT_588099 [Chaetomium tenue]|uniref:Uncharacterized protein n=1 Tax=Chaetomium tenue TaxID=1854479 RepID=A0ACB7PM99_9PEZI|nr:hypothetical protein F5144DRAFT_588099 [Chaetomium globosum]
MPFKKLHHRAMPMIRCQANSTQILNATVPFRVCPSFQEQVHCVEAAVLSCRFESCSSRTLAPASIGVGATSDEAFTSLILDGDREGGPAIRSSYGVYVDMVDCNAEWRIVAPRKPVHVDSTPRVNVFTALKYSLDEAERELLGYGSTQSETVGLVSCL